MKNKDSICGIYGIYDTENNTCLYVGQSRNIKNRFKVHKQNLRNGTHIPEFVEYYNKKENKSDIQCFVLEETDDHPLVKSMAEIKWFNFKHPIFYRAIPSLNNKYFTISDTTRKLRSKIAKDNFKKIKKQCIQCKINNTINKDSICEKCRRKNNTLFARQNDEYNRKNNIVYSDEDIIKMYQEGMSSTEIGIIVGKYAAYVTKVLRRNNIEVRGHGAMSETKKNGLQSPVRIKVCPQCKNSFKPRRKKIIYCSKECASMSLRKDTYKKRAPKDNPEYTAIPNKVVENYYKVLGHDIDKKTLIGHTRWHYNKNVFNPVCEFCNIDYPEIVTDNIKWLSIVDIASKNNINADDLRDYLKRENLLIDYKTANGAAKDPKNLYCFWNGKKNRFLWNEEKVMSLYNNR